MTIRRALTWGLLMTALAAPVHAEMLEFPSPDGMKSWPKLPAVFGWHQDQQASFQNTANALIADGDVYPDGNAVILAKGLPRAGKSLAQVMDADSAAASDSGHAEKPDAITDKDGVSFILVAFTPAKSGKWEANAYAEEGRYYLVFTLSAKSKAEYDKAFPAFSEMVKNYAAMIPW